jgi:hypothetical protein
MHELSIMKSRLILMQTSLTEASSGQSSKSGSNQDGSRKIAQSWFYLPCTIDGMGVGSSSSQQETGHDLCLYGFL